MTTDNETTDESDASAQFKVNLPDMISSFMDEIRGYGSIVSIRDHDMTIELHGEDDYELGRLSVELENALSTICTEPIHVDLLLKP